MCFNLQLRFKVLYIKKVCLLCDVRTLIVNFYVWNFSNYVKYTYFHFVIVHDFPPVNLSVSLSGSRTPQESIHQELTLIVLG